MPQLECMKHAKHIRIGELLLDRVAETVGPLSDKFPVYIALIRLVLERKQFRLKDAPSLLDLPHYARPSVRVLRDCLKNLLKCNILRSYRKTKRSRTLYALTEQAVSFQFASSQFFSTVSEYRYQRGLTTSKLHVRERHYTSSVFTECHAAFSSVLDPSLETEAFLYGLRPLIDLIHANVTHPPLTGSDGRDNSLRAIPQYPFHIHYLPDPFGRLITRPYVQLGSSILRCIRPMEDVNLESGCLFSMDFNSFEPRLLAQLSSQPELLRSANMEERLYDAIQANFFRDLPISDFKTLLLAWMNGKNRGFEVYLDEGISQSERQRLVSEIQSRFAKHFGVIEVLREAYAQEWKRSGILDTYSGLKVPFDMRVKDSGFVAITDGEAKRKALSYITQAMGSRLVRAIIAESVEWEFAQLRIPSNDEFICYASYGLREAAELEVKSTAERIARDMYPDVLLPLETKWIQTRSSFILPEYEGANSTILINTKGRPEDRPPVFAS